MQLFKNHVFSQVWWYTPVIPSSPKVEAGGSQVGGQPGLPETLSQNKIETKGLGTWLKL
jgi:hypothetical protein